MNKTIYENKLLEAIQSLIIANADKLKLDYTISAKVISNNNGLYIIEYQGSQFTVKAREGLSLSPNDIVYIRVVQGNFSEKFIDCKRP